MACTRAEMVGCLRSTISSARGAQTRSRTEIDAGRIGDLDDFARLGEFLLGERFQRQLDVLDQPSDAIDFQRLGKRGNLEHLAGQHSADPPGLGEAPLGIGALDVPVVDVSASARRVDREQLRSHHAA